MAITKEITTVDGFTATYVCVKGKVATPNLDGSVTVKLEAYRDSDAKKIEKRQPAVIFLSFLLTAQPSTIKEIYNIPASTFVGLDISQGETLNIQMLAIIYPYLMALPEFVGSTAN